MINDFELFKNRQIKAKDIFEIKHITKPTAYEFVKTYHYLGDAKFFCMEAFGLFYKPSNTLVGCATFSIPQGANALKGWFGLGEHDTSIYELSRLCVLPELNGTNATSFLLSGSIKEIKKEGKIRAIITLADSSRHVGSIYQVCNFKYYGLSPIRNNFYWIDENGVSHNSKRGHSKEFHGAWIRRSQKHRYAYILDKNLKCLYEEVKEKPKSDLRLEVPCCGGTGVVWDRRYNEYYTCPKCTGEFKKINVG